jgi:hypothetical protein
MKISSKLLVLGALLITSGCFAQGAAPQPSTPVPNQWTLRDYFNRNWQNELVTYAVDDQTASNKKLTLTDAAGTAHSYQWIKEGAQTKIAFMADVPPNDQSTYKLVAGAPQTATDLAVEETADSIRLYNNQTGVLIRKTLAEGQAPIAAVRLLSGAWVGASQRLSTPPLQSYTAQITQRGAVMSEVLCEAKFEGDKTWRMRFRLLTNEPVVTVREASSVGAGASWRLQLDAGFAPTRLFTRDPLKKQIKTVPIATKDGQLCLLQPWVQWWNPTYDNRQSFYGDNSNDMLTLGAMNAAAWVDLAKYAAKVPQAPPNVPIMTSKEGSLYANFDLTGGVRNWFIAAFDKNAVLQVLGDKEVVGGKLTIPHSYVIKYSDYPLDLVKECVLEWPDEATHPRLQLMPQDVERLKRNFKVDPGKLASAQKSIALTHYNVTDYIPLYLVTGDEKVGRNYAKATLAMLQEQVDQFLRQEGRGALNAWPHNQQAITPVLAAVDAVWNAFTPEERTRAKAQVALIGYSVSRPDYWSVPRGYHANPNMTTMVAGYQATAGYLLADHPESDVWIGSGVDEGRNQLINWSDSEGGWLEAPHYAMGSFDGLIGLSLMSRGKDHGALLYNDRMKKVATFFAKISTPPDVRVGGIRHLPRAGNTWLDEPSGLFGNLAAIWNERDPQFAAEMQWMYLQQGSWPSTGIGGRTPTFEGIREAFLDPTITPQKPDYGSTLFPRTGVSLRNGVDDRETQLYMIAGTNHEHYADDSGSFTLWGKGRIVASAFAYAEMKARFQSMVEGGGRGGLMKVSQFKTTPDFDAVRGTAGGWGRQIAFVKDRDMMAPNYFVLRDTIGNAPATWRLWLDGKINILNPQGNEPGVQMQAVQLEGQEDVDTDMVLITNGGTTLGIEEHSTTIGAGVDSQKKTTKITFSLNALTAKLAGGQDVLTVIYPRLKTQKPPTIVVLAEGRAVKITHEAGTDYIFLSDKPFTFDEGKIHFEGTSGLVKMRGDKVVTEADETSKLTVGQ